MNDPTQGPSVEGAYFDYYPEMRDYLGYLEAKSKRIDKASWLLLFVGLPCFLFASPSVVVAFSFFGCVLTYWAVCGLKHPLS